MILVIKNESGNAIAEITVEKDKVVKCDNNCYVDDVDETTNGELIFKLELTNTKNIEKYSTATLLEEIANRCDR